MSSKAGHSKPPFADYKRKVFERTGKTADFIQHQIGAGFIFQIGESDDLRKPSKKILKNKIKTSEMQKKIDYLKKCLEKYKKLTGHGRGIAGVQVGIPERFFAAYTTMNKKKIGVFINPGIIRKSKKLLIYPEMCMSAAPVIAPLARSAWIEFEYYDEFGQLKHWAVKDETKLGRMLNRVFQHEIDHLDGVINIDRVKSPKELIMESDPDFYKKAKFEDI